MIKVSLYYTGTNGSASPMMQKIIELREKYDLHMTAESEPDNRVSSGYPVRFYGDFVIHNG